MIPRMRTAKGVLEVIKAQDPNTEVTLYYIRNIINSGQVPVTEVGVKKLVNVDQVIDYIASGKQIECGAEQSGIRRVQA